MAPQTRDAISTLLTPLLLALIVGLTGVVWTGVQDRIGALERETEVLSNQIIELTREVIKHTAQYPPSGPPFPHQ